VLAERERGLHEALDVDEQEREIDRASRLIEQKYGVEGDILDRRLDAGPGMDIERTQEALLPSISDPKLWLVRCNPGMEQEMVLKLLRKYVLLDNTSQKMWIKSAFATPSSKGYIYVEADKAVHVQVACKGFPQLKAYNVRLIKLTEMVQCLAVTADVATVHKGDWCRVARGVYKNDLCQVCVYVCVCV
jgi:transcription elongation factor SPT5